MNDYLKGILKANKINPDDVQDVDGDMLVTFKDGTQRRICEVWTRVMGYCRPCTEFNKGKRAEFETRKNFTEEQAAKHLEENQDDTRGNIPA